MMEIQLQYSQENKEKSQAPKTLLERNRVFNGSQIHRLIWNTRHPKTVTEKIRIFIWTCRKIMGRPCGIIPKIGHWMHTMYDFWLRSIMKKKPSENGNIKTEKFQSFAYLNKAIAKRQHCYVLQFWQMLRKRIPYRWTLDDKQAHTRNHWYNLPMVRKRIVDPEVDWTKT